jgi:hypothetical protein
VHSAELSAYFLRFFPYSPFSPEPDASSSGARELVSQVSIHMKDINQWQQGYYKCAASNEIGSGESDALRLEVLCE